MREGGRQRESQRERNIYREIYIERVRVRERDPGRKLERETEKKEGGGDRKRN